jgi:hypothetical protein
LNPAVRDQVQAEVGPMIPNGVVQQLTAGCSALGERRSRDVQQTECALIATSGGPEDKRVRLAEIIRAGVQQVIYTEVEVREAIQQAIRQYRVACQSCWD